MRNRSEYLGLAAGMALLVASATGASAEAVNDPAVGGQSNQCWGQIASQIAKMDTSDVNVNGGGGMGVHSRAAAGQGETFGDAIGFNVDGGRTGVGNVSKGVDNPFHNKHPGDGGNGAHAVTNGGLVTIFNPLTGVFGPTGLAPLLCSLGF